MTENGDPYENDLAERVNGILNSEWLDHEQFDNFQHANDPICEIINIYNTERPHMSCNMLTPEQAQSREGKFKKRWKKIIIIHKNVPLYEYL